MKDKIFNICNVYTLLWIIFNLKLLVYTSDVLAVIVYILIVAISVVYAAQCYMAKDNPPFVKIYNVLFAVLCVYGALSILMGEVFSTYKHIRVDAYLENVVKSMIPFYAFYAFAKKGYINRNWLCVFSIIFLIITIGTYYYKETILLFEAKIGEEGVTNNTGYVFVSFIPFIVFFYRKKIIQYIFLAICAYFIVMSMKRGAVLIFAILVFYFFLSNITVANKRKWLSIFLTAALCIVGYYFVMELLNSNAYFMHRVDDTMSGYSSQRDVLYSFYWNLYWHESSFIEFVLGRGADGTIHTGMNYAHNDWLEILIDQGIFGVILFLIFWIRLLLVWIKCPKNIIKISVGMCFIVLFARTFFSMSINDMTIYSTCILGVTVAACYNDELMKQLTS